MAPIVPVTSTIAPIQAPAVSPASSLAGAATPAGSAFQSVFNSAIQTVESFNQNASSGINNFLSGEGEELHDLAIKTQQAEMSFDLFLQVRNKIVSAYQEVMRMQV